MLTLIGVYDEQGDLIAIETELVTLGRPASVFIEVKKRELRFGKVSANYIKVENRRERLTYKEVIVKPKYEAPKEVETRYPFSLTRALNGDEVVTGRGLRIRSVECTISSPGGKPKVRAYPLEGYVSYEIDAVTGEDISNGPDSEFNVFMLRGEAQKPMSAWVSAVREALK